MHCSLTGVNDVQHDNRRDEKLFQIATSTNFITKVFQWQRLHTNNFYLKLLLYCIKYLFCPTERWDENYSLPLKSE